MGKPISSLTTAISIRIPNDLLDAVTAHALSQGFINESGRLDKRGQPNLSAAMSNLLKQALTHSKQASLNSELSDSVSYFPAQPLETMAALENRLAERVCNAVAQQLNQFLSHYNAPSTGDNADAELSSPHSETEKCDRAPVQQTKEDTRERILNAASRGFRAQGYNGIGVNTLAKDAGVTSGAFYGYFRSKEDAFLAVVVAGLDEYRAGIEAFRANYGANWAVALADYYVGSKHRQNLACGCALPTLSPEVIHSNRRVRSAYQTELIKLNEAVAAGLTTGTATEKQNAAWAILAVLAGGVTLARAVWDEAVAAEISLAVHQITVAIASGNQLVTKIFDKI